MNQSYPSIHLNPAAAESPVEYAIGSPLSASSSFAGTARGGLEAARQKKARTPMGVLLAKEPKFGGQPKAGDLVEGTVLAKTGSQLYVNVSPFGTGIVFGREYREAKDIIKNLASGSTLVAKIVDPENDDGFMEMSLKEAGREQTWERLQGLKIKRETVNVRVLGANRGGLIVELEGVQGFLPVSQLNSEHYPRIKDGDKNKILAELQKFVGQTLTVKVLTVIPKEEKLIVSEKEMELEALTEVLDRYHVGDVIEGEVSGVVDFGAFVRFRAPAPEGAEEGASGPELEGLIHISELDYKLVTNPADIVKAGERVKAKIIGIEHGRISLSLKRLKEDPWQDLERRYQKGDLVQGTVIKLDHYGALVELVAGVHGLCHISEWSSPEAMAAELRLGEPYPFRIIELKPLERKLMVSILRKSGAEVDAAVEAGEHSS